MNPIFPCATIAVIILIAVAASRRRGK